MQEWEKEREQTFSFTFHKTNHQCPADLGWKPVYSYLYHQGCHHCHHHNHKHLLCHLCHGQPGWHWEYKGSCPGCFDDHLHQCPDCYHTYLLHGQSLYQAVDRMQEPRFTINTANVSFMMISFQDPVSLNQLNCLDLPVLFYLISHNLYPTRPVAVSGVPGPWHTTLTLFYRHAFLLLS